jgi:hypothetical protein
VFNPPKRLPQRQPLAAVLAAAAAAVALPPRGTVEPQSDDGLVGQQRESDAVPIWNLFEPAARRPQERRIALSTLRTGYPSACGDTLGREKGRRGLALRPFAF